MRYQWLAACAAVVVVLLAASPFIASNRDGLTAEEAAARASETPWDKAKRESAEALQAMGSASRDSAGRAWKLTKDRSTRAWEATKQASSSAWNSTKEGAGDAVDYTKRRSRTTWESIKGWWAERTD